MYHYLYGIIESCHDCKIGGAVSGFLERTRINEHELQIS